MSGLLLLAVNPTLGPIMVHSCSSLFLCSFQSKLQRIAEERRKKVQEQELQARAESDPGTASESSIKY